MALCAFMCVYLTAYRTGGFVPLGVTLVRRVNDCLEQEQMSQPEQGDVSCK